MTALGARASLLAAPEFDYDEGVYWQSLRALSRGARLYADVYSSQPPGFLLLLAPAYQLGGRGIWGARMGVALLSLALVAGAWIAARRFGPGAAIAAAVFAAFDPLLLRGSVTLQADVPAVALAMAAFALCGLATERRGRAALALACAAGALAAAAVMVKLLAAPVAAGLAVLIIAARRRDLAFALGLGGLLATAALLAPLAGDLDAVWRQAVQLHVRGRVVDFGGLTSTWTVPPVGEIVVLGLGAVGVAVMWAGDRPLAVATGAWMLAAVAALVVQKPAYPHHVVAASAPAALAAGVALARAAAAVNARWGPHLVAGAAAVVGVAVVVAGVPPQPKVTPRQLAAAVPAGRPVITDDQFLAAAAGLDTPPALVDTSLLRIRSGDLTAAAVEEQAARFDVGAVVLGTGRLVELPGFPQWLDAEFPVREELGQGRVVRRRAGGG